MRGASDRAERPRGEHQTKDDADPDAAGVDGELGRPFTPSDDHATADSRSGELPDGPPQASRPDDCDAPPCASRHGRHPDQGEQRNSERNEQVTHGPEECTVGHRKDEPAEYGECNRDADTRDATLASDATLQVDDSTGNDAPAPRSIV